MRKKESQKPKVKEKAVSGARTPFAGFLRRDNKVEEIFPEYLIALQPSGPVMGEGGRSSPLIYGRLSMKTGDEGLCRERKRGALPVPLAAFPRLTAGGRGRTSTGGEGRGWGSGGHEAGYPNLWGRCDGFLSLL